MLLGDVVDMELPFVVFGERHLVSIIRKALEWRIPCAGDIIENNTKATIIIKLLTPVGVFVYVEFSADFFIGFCVH